MFNHSGHQYNEILDLNILKNIGSQILCSQVILEQLEFMYFTNKKSLDRSTTLELVRITEAGAIAASQWVGRGDKENSDKAAVDAMRMLINSVTMRGVIVIGEGEKDEAPMFYNGEPVGKGVGPDCDLAVDPIDGTTLMSKGMSNSISVIATSERHGMFSIASVFYMNKIAVGPQYADIIDIKVPVSENIRRVAKVRGVSIKDLNICILDRPRHTQLIADVRNTGAKVTLITDGDIVGVILTCQSNSGIDMLLGIGGTPEGVIAAAAVRCMGGAIQAQLVSSNKLEKQNILNAGYSLEDVFYTKDLIAGDNIFFCATGITDGNLLKGVHRNSNGFTTQSIVMRSQSGTVRLVETHHKLRNFK